MALYSKKIILLILIIFSVCCFALMLGCSMLFYDKYYKTETDNNKWVKGTDTTYSKKAIENAQYKNDIITLTTQSSYGVGSCPISMGPPILPIIPLFFSCFMFDFDVELSFIIENSSDELAIDVQGIRLLKSGDQALPVYRVNYCMAGDGYGCARNNKTNKIVSTSPIILNKGKFVLDLTYQKIGNPDELTVEFGKIFSEGKQINVPSLKLRSNNSAWYVPLMFSGHEPSFRLY
ncbi:MAG: hypothetical protein ABSF13_07495 [Smithella sp.]|jgi:hypothetical protein